MTVEGVLMTHGSGEAGIVVSAGAPRVAAWAPITDRVSDGGTLEVPSDLTGQAAALVLPAASLASVMARVEDPIAVVGGGVLGALAMALGQAMERRLVDDPGPRSAATVIDTGGEPDRWVSASSLVRNEGTILGLLHPWTAPVDFDFYPAVHSRSLRLIPRSWYLPAETGALAEAVAFAASTVAGVWTGGDCVPRRIAGAGSPRVAPRSDGGSAVLGKVERHVERRGAVGEPSHRDDVDAGCRHGADIGDGDSARDDRGVAPGFEIPLFYDSMIAKPIVWGDTRAEAIDRLTRVLDEYRVIGVRTTLPFFRWLVAQPEFVDGAFDTTYLDGLLASRKGQPFVEATDGDADDAAIIAAVATAFARTRRLLADLRRDRPEPGSVRRARRRCDEIRRGSGGTSPRGGCGAPCRDRTIPRGGGWPRARSRSAADQSRFVHP